MFGFWNKNKKEDKKKKQKTYSASSFWYDQYDSDFDYADWLPASQKTWYTAAKKSHDLYKLASVRRAIANFVSIVTTKNIPVNFSSKNSSTDGRTVTLASDVGDKFDISVGLALHEGSHILLSDFDLLKVIVDINNSVLMNTSAYLKPHPSPKETESNLKYFNTIIENRINDAIRNHNTRVDNTAVDHRELPVMRKYGQAEIEMFRRIYKTTGLTKWITKGHDASEVLESLRCFTNWIEDRRIDDFIYTTAPGYRDYYKAMYGHYFEDKSISKAIASDDFTQEVMQSYMLRIVNILNENTDLSKLKGLRDCAKLLDLTHIGRLKSSVDSLMLATELVDLIYTYIDANQPPFNKQGGDDEQDGDGKKQKNSSSKDKGKKGKGDKADKSDSDENDDDSDENDGGDGDSSDDDSEDGDDQQDGNSKGDKKTPSDKGGDEEGQEEDGDDQQGGADNQGDEGEGQEGDAQGNEQGSSATPKSYLNDKVMKAVLKALSDQKEFMDGTVEKKGLTEDELKSLKEITESGTELKHVGDGYENSDGTPNIKGVDCIVVKRVSDAVLKGSEWPYEYREGRLQTYVDKGLKLGVLLGNKLQTRSESRETVYNRLKQGKIDGRMVASLGYENEGVFYNKEVDQFKKANLHISVDYSGSMAGSKLGNSIIMTMAIAKACELARNINVQVSIRSTSEGVSYSSLPHIALVYDSKVDSLKKLAKILSGCNACNTTPEGLAFEAIQDKLMASDPEIDSYFLNISDGEPAYSTKEFKYHGMPAADHTHTQIRKMHERGINVLSYFISDQTPEYVKQTNSWAIFSRAYGACAKYVESENVMQIAKTMNDLFMKKGGNN